jgi:hypothetical protein
MIHATVVEGLFGSGVASATLAPHHASPPEDMADRVRDAPKDTQRTAAQKDDTRSHGT